MSGPILRGLDVYKYLMSFWSDVFDFTAKTLLDKSGNGNDVPLINGNCVNYINDVIITLYPAQIGATITELNKSSGDLNGISVNGSGYIEIDQSELTDPKVYHFKLDTGDDFYLQAGERNWAFSNVDLYGRMDGTEDSDWEWETQDDYFGNLQRGFSLGGDLMVPFPTDMTAWSSKRNFTTPDADTVQYVGTNSYAFNSFFDHRNLLESGRQYKVKILTSESTENFGDTTGTKGLFIQYATTPNKFYDDDGILISKNGEHTITLSVWPGVTNRVSFDFEDATEDWTGFNLKFKVLWVREINATIMIPSYNGILDSVGNAIQNPAVVNKHNGCEVQIDFSGISGVTEAGGGAWSGPAAYDFGDAVINPLFKRIAYNSYLQEIESDYVVFKAFVNSTNLTGILAAYKENNMLVKYFPNDEAQPVLVIQKYDNTRDIITVFCKVGYNGLYTYSQQSFVSNSKQLPVGIALSTIGTYNQYSDRVGPFNLDGLSWLGGAHVAPSGDDTGSGDWAEVTAFDDTAETITLDDVTEFPAPLSSPPPDRIVEVRNGTGTNYPTVLTRNKYTISGSILSLFPVNGGSSVDLGGVVIGGANPSRAQYNYQTGEQQSQVISTESEEWIAANYFELDVVNDLKDYTTIVKATLVGDTIIQETVNYKIMQESPTVYIDYLAEFLANHTVGIYYGMQGAMVAVAGGNARMYLAHSDDETLRAIAGVTSGARATYPCEKVVSVDDVTDNDASFNFSNFMDLSYGTPAADESTNDFWSTVAKNYFQNIHSQAKVIGNEVTWRGGYNTFKNHASTQYVLAYYQVEGDDLYFIVDFTDSLTFGSINEVFTVVSGRNCQVVYKDADIAIAGTPGSSFTVPDLGLDLTATAAGNIKLKLL